MKHKFSIFFFFLAFATTFAQTTLQYNLKKDQVFLVKQQAEQVITQELDGASHVLTNSIDGILQFKVIEVNESDYKIELSFEDLNMKMNSSIQGDIMNVRAKEVVEGDMQSMMFNSLLGNPVNMILSQTGEIIEVIGGDKLVNNMVAKAGIEDEFTLNMMKTSLDKEFGSEALSDSYEQMTFIYSKEQVKVGDTWNNEFSGKLNAKNTWTLTALTDETTSITGVAEVIMNIEEPALTMNLSGNQNSEVITNSTTGFIKKMTVEGLAEGSSTMVQLADQKIPTTIKSTVTYELITP
ncbi:hypothetical protein JQC67_15690 [Aurantibacter crassamenti]|uniref:DUF6263 family protein n=1 Tax=Aurantibacter crassamenti TaxID=1837375 RepID=UPI001939A13B|nr:DUF6263 family protein [Aurantibacter crassamenti]MBM1107598.1 hypothetical protein [Aurantibacter crassamenti]